MRIAARDRVGLEPLFPYRARPLFPLERLKRVDDQRVNYLLSRAQWDGSTVLSLTPLELIDHLAALIPPSRLHRHRYHGVLAPNASLRAAAIIDGRDTVDDADSPAEVRSPPATAAPNPRSPARYIWAMLLARMFESLASRSAPTVGRTGASSPSSPTPLPSSGCSTTSASRDARTRSSARRPPAEEERPEPVPDLDLFGQPESDVEYNQRIAW